MFVAVKLTTRAVIVILLAIATTALMITVIRCGSKRSNGLAAAPAAPVTPAPTAPATTPTGTAGPGSTPSSAGSGDSWTIVGTSVQGRPIRLLALGHGPRKVLLIGGIHGDETEGAYTISELPGAFAEARLGDAVTLSVVEDANPDGRAAGTRENANRVDVNRNFPASNFDPADPSSGHAPLSQPESRVVRDLIEGLNPALVIALHSWTGRQFVNFDGPAGALAERFAASSGLPVEESTAFAPTPGSLGSYAGRDRGTPVLTIEVLKGSNPKAVWDRIRVALLEIIAG